jgi:hypothetical protein
MKKTVWLFLFIALALGVALVLSCTTSSTTSTPIDDDASPDDDTSPTDDDASPTADDDDDIMPDDDDDDNDNDDAGGCQALYDDMYKTCGSGFQDQSGNPIPESEIVQYCESNENCLGVDQSIGECIAQNMGAADCSAMESCVNTALQNCGSADDDTGDDDDNDDASGCQALYNDMYTTCGSGFQDSSGNPIPESEIVQYCEANENCLGVDQSIGECIAQNMGAAACQAMESCVTTALQNCGSADDDTGDDDNDDNDNDDNDTAVDDDFSGPVKAHPHHV